METGEEAMIIQHRQDPHSFYVPGQPKIKRIRWDIDEFDVENKTMHAIAKYAFDKSGLTYLDTSDIEIINVTDTWGKKIGYELSAPIKVLGSRLSFVVPGNKQVVIEYRTSPTAKGMQWMDAHLAGGQPLIYTQGEAINARSYIPCQDTPSIKFEMSSSIRVPKAVRGLIAAAEFLGREEDKDAPGMFIESYNMPYPIPSYLIAFAVGNFEDRKLSHRSRVFALPAMVDAAAKEFADIEKIMLIAERLFGPYQFGVQNFLVLPTAFPYGGMENPCLAFLTPSIITGDGSGIDTLVHETVHAWFGNLVTNANWDAFYLNEGWTVWGTRRIMDEYRGRQEAFVEHKLLECDFKRTCDAFKKNNAWHLTKLASGADDENPDDIYSTVSYFKSERMLTAIEQRVGTKRFMKFANTYIERFKFQSIYTETFVDFVVTELGQAVADSVRLQEWIHEPGMPSDAPAVMAKSILDVQKVAFAGKIPTSDNDWSTSQRQLYLELLPRDGLTRDFMAQLDDALGLRLEANLEVRASFLVAAIEVGYVDVLPNAAAFLSTQGRMKFLRPIYRALAQTPEGMQFAQKVFVEARGGYHPVAITMVENVFKETT